MKTVLLYSGGLDSTAALFRLRKLGHEVICLFVDHAQRSLMRELSAAKEITGNHDVPLRFRNLSLPPMRGTEGPDSVVPARNLVLCSLAASVAVELGAENVALACTRSDWEFYADCRPEFCDSLRGVLKSYDVGLWTPYLHDTKASVIRDAYELAPLDLTWSCYLEGETHCGACGSCKERRTAFAESGLPDPTSYA